jgi:hypothetical protein
MQADPNNDKTSEEIETYILVTGAEERPQEKKLDTDGHLSVVAGILKDSDENTRRLVLAWLLRDRELNILEWLTKTLSGSLIASLIFIGAAIVNPNVDKNFVKDVIPLIVGTQTTLLSGAYTAYVLRSKQKAKN